MHSTSKLGGIHKGPPSLAGYPNARWAILLMRCLLLGPSPPLLSGFHAGTKDFHGTPTVMEGMAWGRICDDLANRWQILQSKG
jgi:hypothetical protein